MGVHVFGKSVKHNSLVRIGLAKVIFGLGYKQAEMLCAKVGIYPQMRMNQLKEPQIMDLNRELSQMLVEGQLKQKVNNDIKLKRDIGSYAGTRHTLGLPVHGQNTRNNAHTAKKLNKLERFRI
ncbi:uncharacterized protein RJT21DRAFT_24336 [Scheffersomyces amazonensis]|uniref:uncharacterized protein n=1 Tax=Scheffersomyces amazonensis TaxID=1078765 RepID=UPI00315C8E04